jgi:hypothetical protein
VVSFQAFLFNTSSQTLIYFPVKKPILDKLGQAARSACSFFAVRFSHGPGSASSNFTSDAHGSTCADVSASVMQVNLASLFRPITIFCSKCVVLCISKVFQTKPMFHIIFSLLIYIYIQLILIFVICHVSIDLSELMFSA